MDSSRTVLGGHYVRAFWGWIGGGPQRSVVALRRGSTRIFAFSVITADERQRTRTMTKVIGNRTQSRIWGSKYSDTLRQRQAHTKDIFVGNSRIIGHRRWLLARRNKQFRNPFINSSCVWPCYVRAQCLVQHSRQYPVPWWNTEIRRHGHLPYSPIRLL